MRFIFLVLFLLSAVSAKVLTINGSTYDFYSGQTVNGSFYILPIGDFEKNVSGEIINGGWSTEVNFDETKTEKILIFTNTSKKVGFNVFEISAKSSKCRENEIRIKPVVFNTTPVKMRLEIEDTAYKNIPITIGEENSIRACLIPGKVYKINLFADGFYSFFYVGK
jgi:hypothetical protein